MEKKYESLPDLPGMERVTPPAEVRLAMIRNVMRNPYEGYKAVFLGRPSDSAYTICPFMVPCPGCGDMMVGLKELPGLFPANALLVETEEDADD